MTTHIQRSAILPYSAQALFELVNDVARYPEFLPWCSAATILQQNENSMKASLTVGKAGIKQSFVTENTWADESRMEMNLAEGPFKQLKGVWEFKSLGEKACRISLDMRFDYAGVLVKATLGPLFNHAANTMVDAFCQRARQLYG